MAGGKDSGVDRGQTTSLPFDFGKPIYTTDGEDENGDRVHGTGWTRDEADRDYDRKGGK